MDRNNLSEARRLLLDQFLQTGSMRTAAPKDLIHTGPSHEPAPLSLSQEQLWRRETGTPGIAPLYNESITVRMAGSIDVLSMEKSLWEIIRRHEIWRTSYKVMNGNPVQLVHPASERLPLPVVDLSNESARAREARLLHETEDMVRERFDLQTGPLVRFKLVRTGECEYRLLVCAHLSVVDGVSAYQIFPRELAALYEAFSSGREASLAPLPLQFSDYARWQRSSIQEKERTEHRAYWRQLAGKLPALNWPEARTSSHAPFEGKIYLFALSQDAGKAPELIGQSGGVTPFTVLASALAELLHQYTGQTDILIGTPSPSGRKRSEVQNLLGYFLNPVILRFDLSGDLELREILRRNQRLILEALSNDDVPLEGLVNELQVAADGGSYPFFKVAISLQPAMPPLALDWSVTSMDVTSGGAPWDLYLAFIRVPNGLIGRVQYNPGLFDEEMIKQLLDDFQAMLKSMSDGPHERVSQLSLPKHVAKNTFTALQSS